MKSLSVVAVVCASYCIPSIVSFIIGVWWASRRLEMKGVVPKTNRSTGNYAIKE
jgi:hypothetical protein